MASIARRTSPKRLASSAYIGCFLLFLRDKPNTIITSSGNTARSFFSHGLAPSASAFTPSSLTFSPRSLSPHSGVTLRMSSSSSPPTSSFSHPSTNLVTIPEAIRAHHSKSPNVKFIDGSWHMPVGPSPRNGRAEFLRGPRIPGALYFDIDDVALPSSSNPKKLPHMKPTSKVFAAAMDKMGISPEDTLYVYGMEGCGFVHRAYWTLRSCGHEAWKVKLIQGSMKEWKEKGGEVEEGVLKEDDERLFRVSEMDLEKLTPKYICREIEGVAQDGDVVVGMEEVLNVVNQYIDGKQSDGGKQNAVIIDARSYGRFIGTEPEPRPGLRGGHMPGSLNVPFVSLLDPDDLTKFRPMNEVRDIFTNAGLKGNSEENDQSQKVICTCGSGVTAAALAVALEECGLRKKEDISIYDGSWIEWGGDDTTPIVTTED
ncbi:hypothetical protein ACHAXS_004278 [Conticribra weissflogii]